MEMEGKLSETLGTRVLIEPNKDKGGKIHIDFFSPEDLAQIVAVIETRRAELAGSQGVIPPPQTTAEVAHEVAEAIVSAEAESVAPAAPRQENDGGDDLYSIRNFSV